MTEPQCNTPPPNGIFWTHADRTLEIAADALVRSVRIAADPRSSWGDYRAACRRLPELLLNVRIAIRDVELQRHFERGYEGFDRVLTPRAYHTEPSRSRWEPGERTGD